MTTADYARAQGEFVRIELELGNTFLDIARETQNSAHASSCTRSALIALRTADRFISGALFSAAEHAAVRELRELLAERLRGSVRS